ncbi:MAG: hypothetical protein OXH99_20040, partial [Bryobacterales bacterium]|nr:hypothetical protein [Bryobacterales bacterium]
RLPDNGVDGPIYDVRNSETRTADPYGYGGVRFPVGDAFRKCAVYIGGDPRRRGGRIGSVSAGSDGEGE